MNVSIGLLRSVKTDPSKYPKIGQKASVSRDFLGSDAWGRKKEAFWNPTVSICDMTQSGKIQKKWNFHLHGSSYMSWHCWSLLGLAGLIQKLQLLQQALLKNGIYCWSRLCISSRIRSANCCMSKDPSIWTSRSVVATRIAGLRGVQTPSSSSYPDISICSPAWTEALSATATSQERLLLTHFQQTRWSRSQMEHSPVGAWAEVSQASQNALLHMPQRSQGAGLISEFSSKTGLVCIAKAALAPRSTNLRVLGSFIMLTSGCWEVQPLANCCIATKSTGAKAIAWKQKGWKESWDH